MTALGELEQDALTEIFNIGVGIAADAIYQMTGEHVPLSVPVVELTSQARAKQEFLEREQRPLCVVSQLYQGEFETEAVLMFPQEKHMHLVRMMVGNDLADAELPDLAQDAMAELGNIILNAVISNLASSLSMRLEGTLPAVTLIEANAVFQRRAGSASAHEESAPVLTLMIDFELGKQRIGGYLAFLLDNASSQLLLQHLSRYLGDALPH